MINEELVKRHMRRGTLGEHSKGKFKHLIYCPFTGLGLYNGFRGNRWLKNRIKIFKEFVVFDIQKLLFVGAFTEFTVAQRHPVLTESLQLEELNGALWISILFK